LAGRQQSNPRKQEKKKSIMFKISSIEVKGFWQTKTASTQFRDDVNIIIGRNGSGKTTFMNIVHAVLAVDGEALFESLFKSVTLTLSDGKRTRTIRASLNESKKTPFPIIEYHISNRRFAASLVGSDEVRTMSMSIRRRSNEELQRIKQELNSLVSVASLSVYRIGGDIDSETRERVGRRLTSTVDQRLLSLMHRLTQYQLELSSAARDVSVELQRDVLISLLYSEPKKHGRIKLEFDDVTERQNLVTAYKQLGVAGPEVSKKIQDHISAVGTTIRNVQKATASKPDQITLEDSQQIDFSALEAFKLTSAVVAKSLEAKTKTEAIFNQVDLFIETLKTFIPDKKFMFFGGELLVHTEAGEPIPLAKLSSGEKQLLILFIEALLQRQRPYIFLADEPELSLHIAWQRNIITAIRSLNPNAQIVVATHSPEIAGKFKNCIFDMGDILHD
jgi:ABC-type lipoprotein export system ATPase subunit